MQWGKGIYLQEKKGINEEIDYLSDNNGLTDAYKKIGEWKASLENLNEEYERDAISSVMTGAISNIFSSDVQDRLSEMYQDYVKYSASDSEEAGAKMGALLAEAQVIAQNEYNASEGAQLALETNKELANQIKNDTGLKSDYWDAGYEMGQQFTKGMASAVIDNKSNSLSPSNTLTPQQETFSNRAKSGYYGVYRGMNGNNHAYGINYVPYDGYQAILHQGERVLTASENRSQKNTPPINITGNNFVIREESDVSKVALEIVRQLSVAYDLAM